MKLSKLSHIYIFLLSILLFNSCETLCVNAGILPYTYAENKAFFLFGLQDYVTPEKEITELWSDFGGKCDKIQKKAKEFNTTEQRYCAALKASAGTRYVYGKSDDSIRYFLDKITHEFLIKKDNTINYYQYFAYVEPKTSIAFTSNPVVQGYMKKSFMWVEADMLLAAIDEAAKNNKIISELPKNPSAPIFRTYGLYEQMARTLMREDVKKAIEEINQPAELVESLRILAQKLNSLESVILPSE